jgi:hypothetical protein
MNDLCQIFRNTTVIGQIGLVETYLPDRVGDDSIYCFSKRIGTIFIMAPIIEMPVTRSMERRVRAEKKDE